MQAKCSRGAVCWGVHETPNPPPALRPLCSCRCFGCRHCCLQPLAFCCYPEPCCPWLQEVPRPSPRPPRAPPMSPARSLRPLSPAPTRRSPRRSPGGDFSVKRGKVLMKGEMGERLPVLPACLWAASAKIRVMGPLKGALSSLSGLWWRSASQPASTLSLRLHPCESIRGWRVNLTQRTDWQSFTLREIFAFATLSSFPFQL